MVGSRRCSRWAPASIRSDRAGEHLLNGAIGDTPQDSNAFAQIVDFSGVERFLDTPVKRFSSGMYLVGLRGAAHLEPDMLVVDEILAVGDAEFQRKCIGRMEEAEQEGRTLIFVSHDLETLTKLCPRACGSRPVVRAAGDTRRSSELPRGRRSARPGQRRSPPGGRDARSAGGARPGGGRDVSMRGDRLRIEVDFEVNDPVPGLDLAIRPDRRGTRVLDELLSDSGDGTRRGPSGPPSWCHRCSTSACSRSACGSAPPTKTSSTSRRRPPLPCTVAIWVVPRGCST